ncbi:cobyric acid synthase [Saliphagus sp. GCM10025317]
MTETVLVAGTASHVGKSTLAAGLCRLLARRGVSVAPFKAQNMSNNARVVLAPDGTWGEIGVSQYVQSRAAGVVPTTDVNPVLLKPRGDGESQLIVHGEAVANVSAGGYYDDHWSVARRAAEESHERLAADHDVIVAEGAGSIAEINLHDRDLANVETARFADADIVIAVDIERGGAFASLYGTLELLPDDLRERVAGAIITKFRGDPSLLTSGIEELEARTGVPILGVVPHDNPGLPAEDSVSIPDLNANESRTVGDDGVPTDRSVTIGVPRLPRISNFTDLEPLSSEPGVRVEYVPLEAELTDADAMIVPGSKNTVDDLEALVDAGFDDHIRAFEGPIVGLCGGYQLLGERLENAGLESTRDIDAVEGLGLLPVETRFSSEKRVERVSRSVSGDGPFGIAGTVTGYEIRMGRTTLTAPSPQPFGPESCASGLVVGTYLHGLFENDCVREAFLASVFASASVPRPRSQVDDEGSPYDRAASLLETHVDLVSIGF